MQIEYHRQFKKDVRLLRDSGWSMEHLEAFIDHIHSGWPPAAQYETHPLKGSKRGLWDTHIRQNWIVLFRKDEDRIYLLRTGTHAMLGIR